MLQLLGESAVWNNWTCTSGKSKNTITVPIQLGELAYVCILNKVGNIMEPSILPQPLDSETRLLRIWQVSFHRSPILDDTSVFHSQGSCFCEGWMGKLRRCQRNKQYLHLFRGISNHCNKVDLKLTPAFVCCTTLIPQWLNWNFSRTAKWCCPILTLKTALLPGFSSDCCCCWCLLSDNDLHGL